MSEMRQSPAERARLDAIWQAHPQVVALKEACTAFARENNLEWNVEGFNRMAEFSGEWQRQHGGTPHSGIVIG